MADVVDGNARRPGNRRAENAMCGMSSRLRPILAISAATALIALQLLLPPISRTTVTLPVPVDGMARQSTVRAGAPEVYASRRCRGSRPGRSPALDTTEGEQHQGPGGGLVKLGGTAVFPAAKHGAELGPMASRFPPGQRRRGSPAYSRRCKCRLVGAGQRADNQDVEKEHGDLEGGLEGAWSGKAQNSAASFLLLVLSRSHAPTWLLASPSPVRSVSPTFSQASGTGSKTTGSSRGIQIRSGGNWERLGAGHIGRYPDAA